MKLIHSRYESEAKIELKHIHSRYESGAKIDSLDPMALMAVEACILPPPPLPARVPNVFFGGVTQLVRYITEQKKPVQSVTQVCKSVS